MARIEDLIQKVSDKELRSDLLGEVKTLKARTRFGLVFERHIPETVLLAANGALRVGDQVRLLEGGDHLLQVTSLNGTEANVSDGSGSERSVKLSELLVVRQFGEPIYPTLTSVGKVEQGGDRPYHAVINAENYHALELLQFAAEGQVDCMAWTPSPLTPQAA